MSFVLLCFCIFFFNSCQQIHAITHLNDYTQNASKIKIALSGHEVIWLALTRIVAPFFSVHGTMLGRSVALTLTGLFIPTFVNLIFTFAFIYNTLASTLVLIVSLSLAALLLFACAGTGCVIRHRNREFQITDNILNCECHVLLVCYFAVRQLYWNIKAFGS